MATETRTLHFRLDPALRAYLVWLEAEGLTFNPDEYDVFAAGYRAALAALAAELPAGDGGAGNG